MKFQRATYVRREADLVGEFYHHARLAGLEVYLEVKLPSTVHRSGEMRVDAVVVNGDDVFCCVEVKRDGRQLTADTRQDRAYRYLECDHRVQTVWINNFAGIPAVVASIAKQIHLENSTRKSA